MRMPFEPKEKDRFLQALYNQQGNYISDKELKNQLGIQESSLVHYAKEMEMMDYIKTAHSMDGWSFLITDSGIHFAESDTFERLFFNEESQVLDKHFDKRDERLTRKVSRRTSRISVGISVIALVVAIFAILLRIPAFPDTNSCLKRTAVLF